MTRSPAALISALVLGGLVAAPAAQAQLISALPRAAGSNPTDLIPCTQGSTGAGTGISRACRPPLIVTAGGGLLAANNLSDIASPTTARANLSLGSLATQSAVGVPQLPALTGGDATTSAGSGAINLNVIGPGGTFPKLTYNTKGLVTGGTALSPSDVTSALAFTPVHPSYAGQNGTHTVGLGWNGTHPVIDIENGSFTGQVALSSDLGGYLPNTGGAITGNLSVAGAGLNLKFDYNQNGNPGYLYQGPGNSINLAVGVYKNSSGANIAGASSGAFLSVSQSGALTLADFAGAAVGSPVSPANNFSVDASGNTIVNGVATFNNAQTGKVIVAGQAVSGMSASALQGAYSLENSGSTLLGWNLTGPYGESDFVNNGQGGSGGFAWWNFSNAGVLTKTLSLDGAGDLTLPGSITGGSLAVSGNIAGGNITAAGNIAGGNITAAGNIIGNFTATNPGAGTSRALNSKLSDVVSVKDYGAYGDNSHDDTAAINYTIAAVQNTGGGTVYFPAGTYKVSAPITINYAYVTLQGTGSHGSVIAPTQTTGPIIDMGPGGAYVGITVKDLGVSAPTNATSGCSICMEANNSEMTVRDVWTHGGFTGIQMDSAATNSVIYQVHNVYVQNPQGYGLLIGQGSDPGTLQEVQIDQVTVAGCGLVCVEIENVSGLYTDGLSEIVSYGGDGIRFNTAGAHGQALFVFMRTTLSDSNSSGSGWEFTGSGPIAHFECTACWSSANSAQGVLINSSGINGWSWNGGVIRSNGLNGVLLQNAASGTAITGATVCDNNQSNSGTYTGLNVSGGQSYFRFVGNSIGSCGYETQHGGANYQVDGVLVNSGSSNHYIITNNLTVGNVNVGVVDNGTGSSKSVTGNVS